MPDITQALSGQSSAKTKNEEITLIKTDEDEPDTIYNLIIKEKNKNGN